MQELIKISHDKATGNESVSARELYDFLGLDKTHYPRWIKTNLLENEFAEKGSDYEIIAFVANGNSGRPVDDYALSIKFAKKLSMKAPTERGEKARDYFIMCEAAAKALPSFHIPTTFSGALRLAADQAEQIEKQQLLIEAQRPAVEFMAEYVEAQNTKGLREVAKILGIKQNTFIDMLMEKKIMYRQSGKLLPYSEYEGWFEVKTGVKHGHAFHQAKLTPEGISKIAAMVAGGK